MRVNQLDKSDVTSGDVTILKNKINSVRASIANRRQTIRSVTALLSSNIISTVVGVIGGLLVARFLGPEVTGPFRTYTIPLTYLMVLHLGTNDGLWRQIPYYVGKEMPERVDALASAAGAFMLFVSVVVSLVFLCLAMYSLLNQDFYGFSGWLSQAFFCLSVFYGSYLISTYRSMNHFVTLAKIQIAGTSLTFLMVSLLPFLRFYGLCARHAFPSLLTVWLYHRNRPLKVNYHFNIKDFTEVIKIGFPFSFWGSIYTSAWVATESLLILSLSGATALGLFSVAYVMRAAMNSLPMVVRQVLLPRIVTAFARDGSLRNIGAQILWVTAGLMAFMTLLAYVGSFLLDIFVPYLIPRYVAGIPVMKVCLWFSVVEAAFLPINTLFAKGRPWLYGRSVIAGVIIFAISTYLLLPVIGGLLAVAVGSLLGRAARTLAAYVDLIILTRQEKSNIRDLKACG